MSTLAIPSQSSTDFQAGTTVVVTKPSGLAVGELMLAFVCSDSAKSLAWPSGFAEAGDGKQSNVGAGTAITPLYKIADSGDVAATNFTFTAGAGNTYISAGILRITGFDVSQNFADTSISNFAAVTDSANPVFAMTITPSRTDSLIIFTMYGVTGSGHIPMSNYAMVTSNPTWTEQWSFLSTASFDKNFALATAIRPQTTATGNFSATGGNAIEDWVGYAFFITRNTIFTVSLTDTVTDTDVLTPRLTLSVLLTNTISTIDSVSTSAARIWTKITKNVNSWINQQEDL